MQCVFYLTVCRKTVLPMLLSHVKALMEAGQELEICVDILSDMMKLLYCQEMVSILISTVVLPMSYR